MEKIKTLTLIVCVLTGFALSQASSQYGETYMAAEQAQKKFGAKPFDPAKFKKGDSKLKGEMAADLILKKTLIGKPLKAVRELLGPPDGYFENKGVLAYIISPEITKRDVWQIVILPDKDWKNVDEIRIHKNCCD